MLAAIRSRVAVVSARRAFTSSRIVQLRDVGDSVPVNIMNGPSQQLSTCHSARRGTHTPAACLCRAQ